MAPSTVKGILSLKKQAGLSDFWTSYLCEYAQESTVLSVKSMDGKFTFWERAIEGAWSVLR
jgi:hypothetical protein